MLISDYLSSNIIICICFFWFDPIYKARAEIQKYFRLFLANMKTSKFAFEIYWPLDQGKDSKEGTFLENLSPSFCIPLLFALVKWVKYRSAMPSSPTKAGLSLN